METKETFGVMGYVDENGNQSIHYPITKAELVDYAPGKSGMKATDAQGAIDELSEMATAAKNAADDAKKTAETAKSTADTAQAAAQTAQGAAQTAQSAATAAQTAANTAKTTAEAAQAAAQAAQSTANTAKSTAETAKSTAQEAKTAADKATLLSDDTAALLGGAKTVNEALSELAKTSQSLETGKANVEFGEYTGAGKYGSGNKNSLSFSFTPELVMIFTAGSSSNAQVDNVAGFFRRGVTYQMFGVNQANFSDANHGVSLQWGENGLTWYSTYNAEVQLNKSKKYYYVAIG